MKLIDKTLERCRERIKLFLALDILFTLSAIYFSIRILFISTDVLVNEKYSTDFPNVLMLAMTFSLGMTYAIRVVEMLITGKIKYFLLYLFTALYPY
ncbi:hypothetical protein [Virgibacillus ndiopensis]|uniref:hypothetical protein n=1 Tax=Virgibacillus ndiopensis TaxID=2004408 RepID=UPI000C0694FA|nr:hypothetical protein [Virgibacillus ndiopensis]